MVSVAAPVQSANLGTQVAQRLRRMILRRDLKDGTRLVEENLAAQFGVSRGPIRDALAQLEREGLVRVHRRGVYVTGLSPEAIGQLYDVRKALELLAISEASSRATQEQFGAMRACVDRMRAAAQDDDHAAFADADVDFHGLLFTLSPNRWLRDVWNQYLPILATILQSAVGQDQHLHNSAEDHHELLQLITSRDPGLAHEASEHIDRSRERMILAYRRLIAGEEPPR